MESDESPMIDDPKDVAWVTRQRQIVIDYLSSQRCEHNGVSLEPRWFVAPLRCPLGGKVESGP
jgi:hypothetical protein